MFTFYTKFQEKIYVYIKEPTTILPMTFFFVSLSIVGPCNVFVVGVFNSVVNSLADFGLAVVMLTPIARTTEHNLCFV